MANVSIESLILTTDDILELPVVFYKTLMPRVRLRVCIVFFLNYL